MTSDRAVDNREFCAEMLVKLDRPLSFIGERRQNFVVFDGEWTDIRTLLRKAGINRSFKDRARTLLQGRLKEIKDELRSENLTREEAEGLYEEGIAVKRAIHLLDRGSMEIDEDRHSDTRRWIRYGRSVSP
ncbi:MAG: hypothetical protein U9R75_03555 [Candidatus Thermoplasmatota archaeon]|nr:hypothetical protein [Candidatus Thermoplasmatota archaeon]